jgi:hypothetical protein
MNRLTTTERREIVTGDQTYIERLWIAVIPEL